MYRKRVGMAKNSIYELVQAANSIIKFSLDHPVYKKFWNKETFVHENILLTQANT